MFVTQATAQGVEGARAALVLLVLVIAAFWRLAVRILIASVVVAVGAGTFLLLQGLHR
jgi:hypothetical protein